MHSAVRHWLSTVIGLASWIVPGMALAQTADAPPEPRLVLTGGLQLCAVPPPAEAASCRSSTSRPLSATVVPLAGPLTPNLPGAVVLRDGEALCLEGLRNEDNGSYRPLLPIAQSSGAPLLVRLSTDGKKRTLHLTNRTADWLSLRVGPTESTSRGKSHPLEGRIGLRPYATEKLEFVSAQQELLLYDLTFVPTMTCPPPPSPRTWQSFSGESAPMSASIAVFARIDAMDLGPLRDALLPTFAAPSQALLSWGGSARANWRDFGVEISGAGAQQSLGGPAAAGAQLNNFWLGLGASYTWWRQNHLSLSSFADVHVRALSAHLGQDSDLAPGPSWAEGYRDLGTVWGAGELGFLWNWRAGGLQDSRGDFASGGTFAKLGVSLPFARSSWSGAAGLERGEPSFPLEDGPRLALTSVFLQLGVELGAHVW